MLGRVKLNITLLTCDQGNFNQITAWSRNRTLVTGVRDTCTTPVPPALDRAWVYFTQVDTLISLVLSVLVICCRSWTPGVKPVFHQANFVARFFFV